MLRSESTKGPIAGRGAARMWAAQLHAHGDNQGFQSREARVSSEIMLAQREHSRLWSQTIPGGGAHGCAGQKAIAGPVRATSPLWASVSHLLSGSKGQRLGAGKPRCQEQSMKPRRPQVLHLTFQPPFPHLQNGKGNPLPRRALRFK